jgi:hypothetical protein
MREEVNAAIGHCLIGSFKGVIDRYYLAHYIRSGCNFIRADRHKSKRYHSFGASQRIIKSSKFHHDYSVDALIRRTYIVSIKSEAEHKWIIKSFRFL